MTTQLTRYEAMLAVVEAAREEAHETCWTHCVDPKHPVCDALRKLYATPETEWEEAGRLLGQVGKAAGALTIQDVLAGLQVARPTPHDLIAACERFLAPKPLTDAEKLSKLRDGFEKAVIWLQRVEQEYPGSINSGAIDKHLRSVLEETR